MTGDDARHLRLRDIAEVAEASGELVGELPLHDDDRMLDLVFVWFRACFRPERTRGRGGIFHYEVNTASGVRHRYVTVTDGHCTSARDASTPNATIGVDMQDLLALATGELKGTDAFISGRLKISGDVFFAMNWIEWFGSRSAQPTAE
ncbi:SCP2 sterol-binding domain-containing protein [Streptomyces sp. CA-135486]|uniref:SCP2 sterol-binding domain-containing protein n=1 Tax=Streptomyces sp. CA-135486 TaxID=3240049 RepID=UPI003D927FFC